MVSILPVRYKEKAHSRSADASVRGVPHSSFSVAVVLEQAEKKEDTWYIITKYINKNNIK